LRDEPLDGERQVAAGLPGNFVENLGTSAADSAQNSVIIGILVLAWFVLVQFGSKKQTSRLSQ